jgi:hypothetical protein
MQIIFIITVLGIRAIPGDPKGVGDGKFSGATTLGVANENYRALFI